jgi:hypothetical protein
VTAAKLGGRAFFEHQQQRRRAAQALLSGKPPPRGLPPTLVVSPAATTRAVPLVPERPELRILVTNGANAGRAVDLHPGELSIGREEGSEIHLEESTVSHTHAMLRVSSEEVTIEDLRSTNGTAVNGVAIKRQTRLHPGDEIDVGSVQLVIEQQPTGPGLP